MRTYTRDETEHGVEYVTLAEAEAEIKRWREKANRTEHMKRETTFIEKLLYAMMLVVTPSMLAIMAWVAWHFITKYW